MYKRDVFRGSPGDDNACVAVVWIPVGSEIVVAGSGGVDRQIRAHIAATGEAPPPCESEPADPAASPGPAGPSDVEILMAAEAYVETLVPKPGLSLEPPNGEGFVGVPVLVQLGRDATTTAPPETVTLFGKDYTLTAELTATTTIDWGDGTVDEGITGQGATYEQVDGDLHDERLIRHVYTESTGDDVVTITATDTWKVELTLEGVGTNTVTGITLSESADIDIVELQAVVTQ